MKNHLAKIGLFILFVSFFYGCDTVKKVPDGKKLLVANEVYVNQNRSKDPILFEKIVQIPNSKLAGSPLGLHLYNFADSRPDSTFYKKYIEDTLAFKKYSKILSEKQLYRMGNSFLFSGIHKFMMKAGEAPVIIDEMRTKRTISRLNAHFYSEGYFNHSIVSKTDSVAVKKGKISYEINTGIAYVLDSITHEIFSPDLIPLYEKIKPNTFLKKGDRFQTKNFEQERERLANYFRNQGVYKFQQSSVRFEIDTIQTNKKANVKLIIDNFTERINDEVISTPYKIYKISEINIFIDNPHAKNKNKIVDSLEYNGFKIFSTDKIKFRPKAITDPIFISKNSNFSDLSTNLTSRYLNNLKNFNFPSIQYKIDDEDPMEESLISNIYLVQKEKYFYANGLEVIQSNIQDFGISGNLNFTIRNIFNGAERLEISPRASIGSARDFPNPKNIFFNILEYGTDFKLYFPRVLLPFNTEKIIPKLMIPTTTISAGFSKQENIGLDKESLNAVMSYDWNPKKFNTAKFDLFNIQYVNNINTSNYYVVYQSSYRALNALAQPFANNPSFSNFFDNNNNLIIDRGTQGFTNAVLNQNTSIDPNDPQFKAIRSIEERRRRLTENNLILASSFSYNFTNKKSITDHQFFGLRTKIESAGNLLSILSSTTDFITNQNGKRTIFDVEYSQYLKGEIEFIKHWDFKRGNILAFRTFFGLAAPYGNSNNIPFTRSYFAGGSNDNRAWQPYSLGPGRSGGINDFNEANMKIALNFEYRFDLLGSFKGALFADVGNIWNVLDNIDDPSFRFNGASSLLDLAGGTGFGLRYDFSFFVVRFDLGFKTYNPANEMNKRWFNEYNFANSVINIGVNYPF